MENKNLRKDGQKLRYFDKNGVEILAGMTLRHYSGAEKKVCECGDEFGSSDLGFVASNPRFLERHPDWPVEYYPLCQFNLAEWQIA